MILNHFGKLLTENSLKQLKISNPTEMANGFNDFFSNIAGNINNLIPKTSVLPESFLKNYPDINFEFGLCSPEEIVEIIKSLENKKKLWTLII